MSELLESLYKKDADGKAYLFLKKSRESFEEQMIRNNMPEGILAMVKSERGDRYKYEITGRKNLGMMFERVPMNGEQIESVLKGILKVLERGRDYLLSEDNFILLPEYIYLGIPGYEVTLCYYPEYGIPFVEQMGKLFELFLNRVDYREEQAIAMVYALYMQLQEPDITFERIQKLLSEQEKQRKEKDEGIKEIRNKKEKAQGLLVKKEEAHREAEQSGTTSKEKREGLWERFRKEMGTRLLKGGRGEDASSVPLSSFLPAACVRETPPEWGVQETKVLSAKTADATPMLLSGKTGEVIYLTKFPFYIGSLPEYMDYVIPDNTVSRFHAKLICREGNIYLTDLNSTNGTKVNGHTLNVQEQARLEEGDRIVFAEAEFCFTKTGGLS